MNIHKKFETYLNNKRFYHFEGNNGVDRVEEVAREIGGYDDIREFLADNPGACQSLIDFIYTWIPTVPEWASNLNSLVDSNLAADEDRDEEVEQ